MDYKVLGKVLFQVLCGITLCLIGFVSLSYAIMYLGIWSALIIPIILLIYVIKHMYEDEMFRQGKREHL